MAQETLSPDAIIVGGAVFGLMVPDGKTRRLAFALKENRPTQRCAAGLDELERNGYIQKHWIEDGPGYYYTLHKSCDKFARKVVRLTKQFGPLIIVEPIGGDNG